MLNGISSLDTKNIAKNSFSNIYTNNMMTRISSNGKTIITFSDIHADIHSLLICLKSCAMVITGVLTSDELERELQTPIIVEYFGDEQILCKKLSGEIYDTSLGFSWNKNCDKIIVIVGDIIDGKRVATNTQEEHEYSQIEFKILAFLNALIFQGAPIYKLMGNHEVINIIEPDPTYIFTYDKFNTYMMVNGNEVYRQNFFKLGQVGYRALFYRKCYVLLQIDDTIFVHGQLVGENYSYYEVLNDFLNYNIDSDIKKNFGTDGLIKRIYQKWYEFIVLTAYKGIYFKKSEKWQELYDILKTNPSGLQEKFIFDVDMEISKNSDNRSFDPIAETYRQHLKSIKSTIDFLHSIFTHPNISNCHNSSSFLIDQNCCQSRLTTYLIERNIIKMNFKDQMTFEYNIMKHYIFNTMLYGDTSEVWKRYYGFTTSNENPMLCTVINNDLECYNKNCNGVLAERIVVGHCTQNVYTHTITTTQSTHSVNTSYNHVTVSEDGMTERLTKPSFTGCSYYNSKTDNLIFGITMDCPHHSHKGTHKLYKVDVGCSRGFDVFTNYEKLFDEIDFLEFFGTNIAESSIHDIHETTIVSKTQETKSVEFDEEVTMIFNENIYDAELIKETKKLLIKEFIKTFLSRVPQVLEIKRSNDNVDIQIVRATIKNIYLNQPRHVLNELLKTSYLREIVENGGYNFVQHQKNKV